MGCCFGQGLSSVCVDVCFLLHPRSRMRGSTDVRPKRILISLVMLWGYPARTIGPCNPPEPLRVHPSTSKMLSRACSRVIAQGWLPTVMLLCDAACNATCAKSQQEAFQSATVSLSAACNATCAKSQQEAIQSAYPTPTRR